MLRLMLARYANEGDLAQLCVAACVSTMWRDAAKEPKLWVALTKSQHLKSTSHLPRLDKVTNKVLAKLVKRAGVGGLQLDELDVTRCKLVSARGVVAALKGASLQGKLTSLKVADTRSSKKDGDVIADLRRFLAEKYRDSGLDVSNRLPCAARIKDARGRQKRCARLCDEVFCVECDIGICGWCQDGIQPLRSHQYDGPVFCEHVCADCGCVRNDHVGLMACPGCDSDGDHRLLCYHCFMWCYECKTAHCSRRCVDSMELWCKTDMPYCERCIENRDWAHCIECDGKWSYEQGDDPPHYIKTAEDWVDELEDDTLEAHLEERNLIDDPGLICYSCIDALRRRALHHAADPEDAD